jgi:hypothetical protein
MAHICYKVNLCNLHATEASTEHFGWWQTLIDTYVRVLPNMIHLKFMMILKTTLTIRE